MCVRAWISGSGDVEEGVATPLTETVRFRRPLSLGTVAPS
jgi:hypothetical protein